MKNLFISILLFFITTMNATNPIEIKIWGQDSSEPQPTLTVYPATNGNGMAIIACPGGGYTHLAIDHEGKSMSAWFNSLGITYAVLVYRMPGGNHEIPLSDAQQAMRIMRQHAKEWNIQKLGIMGSSAGGHLASTVATHYTDAETKPDFQILFYPRNHDGCIVHPRWLKKESVRTVSIRRTSKTIQQRASSKRTDPTGIYNAQQQ